ncbi:MAG: SDR family oxidoreductase [Actinobacteria bacterium]|nr:SDR family oxidoreductase [Actinomycetota bacterium]
MEGSEAANGVPAGISMDGERVLLTGAASGIGRATATCLAQLGADLVITDISPMVEVTAEAESAGAEVTAIQGDLIDDDFLDGLMDEGPYDALAAVAGVFAPPAGMSSKEGFDWVLEINLRAPMRLASACIDQMGARGGGNIVLVGSAAGRNGGAVANDSFEYAAYAASKGGVHSVVRWLSRRGAPQNVVVNGVAPGPVETPLSAPMTFNPDSIPIGRMGKPHELGWPIALLCSPAASFTVGAVLDVNGGSFIG